MQRSEPDPLEPRLQETEIKLAFLERELSESREAIHTLHERLQILEGTLDAMRRAADEPSQI